MRKLNYTFAIVITVLLFISGGNIYSQAVSDPASLPVYVTTGTITVDGMLNEGSWAVDVPHLKFLKDGTSSGNSNTPTLGVVVKDPYTDLSTCYVKFLRSGYNLYISLNSNDHQVCRFDWEGDGMFMKIKNKSGANEYEIKNYVGVVGTPGVGQFVFETNAPAGWASGVGYPLAGTTIYDSTNVDNGYTSETLIHLDSLGYTNPLDTVTLMVVIFDPDNYSLSVPPWGPNGNFYKQWWGSEWGGVYRKLIMKSAAVPVELTSFTASCTPNGSALQWETATETNNQGFEVQRSIDNRNFTTVAFVRGKGTTTEKQYYNFWDNTELTGSIYYRLKQLDFGGSYSFSNTVEVTRVVSYGLSQNYPNPFNPTTAITYSIPQNSFVTLKVYDVLGSEVADLVNGVVEAGVHKVNFSGVDLNSGVYFYTIKAGNFSETKKLMLMK